MADNDVNSFTFGNFISTPPQSHPFYINGVSQLPKNLSFPQKSPLFGSDNSTNHNLDPDRTRVGSGSFKGALPLSFFGEVEVEDDLNNDFNGNLGKLNNWVDPKKDAEEGKFVGNDQKIVSGNGSGLDFDDHDVDDDDDDDDFGEWEFRGVFSGNIQDDSSGAKVEKVVVMPLENQAGQDAFISLDHKPGLSSFSFPSNDLFGELPRVVDKFNERDIGLKSTTMMTNGFVWDPFPGAENTSNGSGITVTDNNSMSSSLPRSNDLFAFSRGAEKDVGHNSTGATTNNFMWDAFSRVENITNGSEISDTTSISAEHKPLSSSLFPPSDNLFTTPLKAVNNSSEMNVEVRPTFDAFTGFEKIDNRSGISDNGSISDAPKPDSSSFLFPSDNLFVVSQGVVDESNETFGSFKKPVTNNGFMFDAFPEVKLVSNVNGFGATVATTHDDVDLDDFGDFIDASQEVRTGEQQVQVFPHTSVAAETQLENGKSQDKLTRLLNSREALPLSLFGDCTEETSEPLNLSEELDNKHTSVPGNDFIGQGSMVSINGLISNLYSQSHTNQSVGFDEKRAENGIHNSKEEESSQLSEDDGWDDDSWEFKGAVRETAVVEQASSDISGGTVHETSQNFQNYIDFYTELRNSLCFLLSPQLDELRKARSTDTGTGFAEMTETLDNEIEEVHKLVEQCVVSQVVSEKHLERSSCLNEVFKILEEPKFKFTESEFSLSKKLQLAVNDWRVATDLLRHANSILKSLSLGSAEEQCLCVSTWSNITDACAQELRYGAMIWKRAFEQKVQHQVLSDCRGQKYIQALGEIYKVVELLGLAAKVYKAWLLCSVSDSSRFTDRLNECSVSWSSSGLEEALQSLSDDFHFGCDETPKALLDSLKNIRDSDVVAMHDCVFGRPKSICRLSLLPQEMLPDLKTVVWNGKPYFLSLANFWANLISSEPPQLPCVQVNLTDG